jgi:hypothetical protein
LRQSNYMLNNTDMHWTNEVQRLQELYLHVIEVANMIQGVRIWERTTLSGVNLAQRSAGASCR